MKHYFMSTVRYRYSKPFPDLKSTKFRPTRNVLFQKMEASKLLLLLGSKVISSLTFLIYLDHIQDHCMKVVTEEAE